MKKSGTQNKFTVKELYQEITRSNQQWGIPGYSCVKRYQDPAKQVLEREYLTQKKGGKPKVKPTKKGSFLDPILSVDRKKYPNPVHYNIIKQWPDAKPKDAKKSYQTKRNTYIEQIYMKKLKYPGPGQYNLMPTDQQIKDRLETLKLKKKTISARDSFVSNNEFHSSRTPGAGNYNPHKSVQKLKVLASNNHKDMIAKHKQKQEKQNSKLKLPDIGTYKPVYQSFRTFSKTENEKKSTKSLPRDERFKLPSAKVFRLNTPGPGKYQIQYEWPGKKEIPIVKSDRQANRNWYNKLSLGTQSQRSIYYQ